MVALVTEREIIEKTVSECKLAHQSDTYFDIAERSMAEQWGIGISGRGSEGADFSRVLELSPGYGRNTARVAGLPMRFIWWM